MKFLLSILLISCVSAAASSQQAPAVFPSTWKYHSGGQAAFASHAMVASSSHLASEVGREVLESGGNAVDAAVAVGFALAVVYPEAGNLGGGGYMVIRMADGRVAALDYRETAPASASRNMYVDSAGKVTNYSLESRAASGIPGSVAGLLTAHARYGAIPLSKVMAPAIRLAANGFVVDSALNKSIASNRERIGRYAGGEIFLPNGKPIATGSLLIQHNLAATLRTIERDGASGFYRGRIAAAIVAEMTQGCLSGVAERARASRGCGLFTSVDLGRYRPVWRQAIRTRFRGYTLVSMPPSSSGGVTVGESLNILDGYRQLPPFGTAAWIHVVSSAFQRAFIDRNALLGDPDFVKVPVERLASIAHAFQLRSTIDFARATPTQQLGVPAREGTETTHYSVVDAAGNAIATTTTLNDLYGSGVFVRSAGFFMNNEMDDFTSQPGHPNTYGLVQGEANAIAPGKRMLSAMAPTIVLDQAGKLFMVLGARGGPRIITSVAQVLLNVIEHHMSLSDAMSAPRFHHQALPDEIRIEDGGFDPSVLAKLKEMGHTLTPRSYIGASVVAIMRVRGGWQGMDDPRGSLGGAEGY